ncbi:hypothetical protein LguiB_024255 [Lonicera macranthoides]
MGTPKFFLVKARSTPQEHKNFLATETISEKERKDLTKNGVTVHELKPALESFKSDLHRPDFRYLC